MCYRPITKKDGDVVPCGKCPKCIARRVSSWSFRLIQEDMVSDTSDFITLTYDTKNIPYSDYGHHTLYKPHVQHFFKRLRKRQFGNEAGNIKYYAVGEYGGRTHRPHYHLILFNADIELIQPAWDMGSVFYGKVSGASVGYCLKYMSKHKKSFRRNSYDDRQPEFAVMSKGLGVSYLSEKNCNWHIADLVNRMYCTVPESGGKKIAMPRYYKEKIYYESEKSAIAEAFALKMHDKKLEKLAKQTSTDVRNEQRAIDAAFERMYKSSLKTVV